MNRIYLILVKHVGSEGICTIYTDDPVDVSNLLKSNKPEEREVKVFVLDSLPQVVSLEVKTDEVWVVNVEKDKDSDVDTKQDQQNPDATEKDPT